MNLVISVLRKRRTVLHEGFFSGVRGTEDRLAFILEHFGIDGLSVSADYFDLELSYRPPPPISLFGGGESIAVWAFSTWMRENSTSNLGARTYNRAGQTGGNGGIPRWQSNLSLNYLRGPLTVTLQERFIAHGVYNAEFGPRDIDDNVVGGAFYTNARVSWMAGDTWTIYGSITNLFDRAPPLAPNSGAMGTAHTNESLFDALGRRYSLGMKMQF